jgi:hypothetical protein
MVVSMVERRADHLAALMVGQWAYLKAELSVDW